MDSQRLAEVLYSMHDYFNVRYFDNALPRPIFTFSAEGRNRLGHYWPGKWMEVEEGKPLSRQTQAARRKDAAGEKSGVLSADLPDEINMHSEAGLCRPIESVLATVYHEMSHQAQHRFPHIYGKPGKNNYHNRAWHVVCQRCGLVTEGSKGFTKVTDEFRAAIADFQHPADWMARIPNVRTKQLTRLRLWECSCGPKPVKLRAAVEIDVTCNVCGSAFEKQEADKAGNSIRVAVAAQSRR